MAYHGITNPRPAFACGFPIAITFGYSSLYGHAIYSFWQDEHDISGEQFGKYCIFIVAWLFFFFFFVFVFLSFACLVLLFTSNIISCCFTPPTPTLAIGTI